MDFEEAYTPRGVLGVRLATCATVRTEKRVVRVRFSYKRKTFVEDLIVLDLDDKFDLVLGMPWLARHDPVINWEKRTIVRFNNMSATESDGPVKATQHWVLHLQAFQAFMGYTLEQGDQWAVAEDLQALLFDEGLRLNITVVTLRQLTTRHCPPGTRGVLMDELMQLKKTMSKSVRDYSR
ncbi:hypothetical protein DVH05_012598 [Phytophthora capsici]|nr:hypothetical protein DVH05_012598 [Phytophthora capsici]